MTTTLTPPPGYKLVKGEDIKDRLPIDDMKCWYEHSQDWRFSVYSRNSTMTEADTQNIYAIPSSPESITDEAKTIVAGDRASDYGDANESFARIAKLWSAYTCTPILPWDVAQMMILLKVSRAKTSRKRDTLVDIVGYAECASKLEEPK